MYHSLAYNQGEFHKLQSSEHFHVLPCWFHIWARLTAGGGLAYLAENAVKINSNQHDFTISV